MSERPAEIFALIAIGALGSAAMVRAVRPTPTLAHAPPTAQELGAPDGRWPTPPAHAIPVADYRIEAKLDPSAHTLDGQETITFRNVSDKPLGELRLHLYLNAFANDATLFRRARVGGFRGGDTAAAGYVDVTSLKIGGADLWPGHVFVSHQGESPQDPLRAGAPAPIPGAPDDETDVRVPLATPLAPGASVEIEIAFHDLLPGISERTGFFGSFHFVGQWFPKLAKLEPDGTFASFPFHHLGEFYADYGSYDVTLDVPANFVVGAVGRRVSSEQRGDRLVVRHQQSDVHDFAWTAWDKFVRTEATLDGGAGPIAVTLLAPPGHESVMARELETVKQGLASYGARFGAYPYDVLTVVHPPAGADEAGGMEYPTLITTGGGSGPALGAHEIEVIAVHELGHQWFYGMVGTHEVAWPAGDEGFNSFGESEAMRDMFGNGSAFASSALDLDELALHRYGVTGAMFEPVFSPVPEFAHGRSYGSRVYGATAAILETLRRTFGPRFTAAMGLYARRYRFSHPTPEDFFSTLEREAGRDVAEAARAALTEPGGYDVIAESLSSARAHEPSGWFSSGSGRTKRDGGPGVGWSSAAWIVRRGHVPLPIDVELRFADGQRRREIVRFESPTTPTSAGGDTWRRIDADGPSELVAVVVDPDGKLLIDADRSNDFVTARAARGGVPVTREWGRWWHSLLLREVGP
jgi:hypothetical protein